MAPLWATVLFPELGTRRCTPATLHQAIVSLRSFLSIPSCRRWSPSGSTRPGVDRGRPSLSGHISSSVAPGSLQIHAGRVLPAVVGGPQSSRDDIVLRAVHGGYLYGACRGAAVEQATHSHAVAGAQTRLPWHWCCVELCPRDKWPQILTFPRRHSWRCCASAAR